MTPTEQIEALRKALEPFAFAISGIDFEMPGHADDEVLAGFAERVVTYGHLRAAAAALSATPSDAGRTDYEEKARPAVVEQIVAWLRKSAAHAASRDLPTHEWAWNTVADEIERGDYLK